MSMFDRDYYDHQALDDAAKALERAARAAWQSVNGSSSKSFPNPSAPKEIEAAIRTANALIEKARPEKKATP
jgi:hypothetical protein